MLKYLVVDGLLRDGMRLGQNIKEWSMLWMDCPVSKDGMYGGQNIKEQSVLGMDCMRMNL